MLSLSGLQYIKCIKCIKCQCPIKKSNIKKHNDVICKLCYEEEQMRKIILTSIVKTISY